jgi:hypothetical protein
MLLCKMWGVCIENNDLKNLHIRQKASADGVISQLQKKKKKTTTAIEKSQQTMQSNSHTFEWLFLCHLNCQSTLQHA